MLALTLSCSDVEVALDNDVWAAADTGASASEAIEPHLAMSGDGQACLVWLDGKESDQLMAARYHPLGGWSAPETIAEASGIRGADVVMADQGELLVVWTQDAGADRSSTFYARFEAGAGWAPAELIDAQAEGCDECSTGPAKVSLDADGNGIALYFFEVGDVEALRASHYQPGSGWTAGAELEVPETAWFDGTVRGSRAAAAVWAVNTTYPGSDLWVTRYSADSGWQAPEKVASDQPDLVAPRVILDGSGGTFVAFPSAGSLHVVRREQGDSWSDPVLLDEEVPAYAYWPFRAQADDAGSAQFLWMRGRNLVGASFAVDGGWTLGPEIETPGDAVQELALAVASDGRALASWVEDTERGELGGQARRYAPATGWEEALATDPGSGPDRYARDPQVATSDGSAMVVWISEWHDAANSPRREFRWSTAPLE